MAEGSARKNFNDADVVQGIKMPQNNINGSQKYTMFLISGQFIPRKKRWSLISFAPPFDPKRLAGSLFNSAFISCRAARLTWKFHQQINPYTRTKLWGFRSKGQYYTMWSYMVLPECYWEKLSLCARCWQMSSADFFPWMAYGHKASHKARFLNPNTNNQYHKTCWIQVKKQWEFHFPILLVFIILVILLYILLFLPRAHQSIALLWPAPVMIS